MTYVKVSVSKPGNNRGVGGDKKDLITFIDLKDIQTFPPRDANGIIITDNILMVENAYAVKVYATATSIKISHQTEGEEDAKGTIQSLEFAHPGDDDSIEEFLSNWVNRDIICVVENCSSNKKKLLGTPCAPLIFDVSSEDSKDMNKSTLTLKSKLKSAFRAANYLGTVTYADITGTASADDTTIDASNGPGRYQLVDGSTDSASLTTITGLADGDVVTLLGSGGSFPSTIVNSEDFILAFGTTWNAIAGTEITFKAFKDGPATFKFIELSRQ